MKWPSIGYFVLVLSTCRGWKGAQKGKGKWYFQCACYVPSSVLETSHFGYNISSKTQPSKVAITPQFYKQGNWGSAKGSFAQGHRANYWQSQDLKPGLSD